MRLQTIVLAGILAGAGVGTAVALADDPAPTPAAPSATATVTAATGRAPALPPLPARNVRLLARAPDPGGEAPWAVRGFTVTERGRTSRCLQLGREVDGRFGWIAAGQPFVPASFVYGTSPINCSGGTNEFRFGPLLERTSLLGDATTGLVNVDRSIVWGRLAPGTAAVEVRGLATLRPRGQDIALDVRTGGTLTRQLKGFTIDTGAKRTAFGDRGGEPPLRHASRPVPGTTRVAVRTPDPAGGPAWGLLAAKATDGSACLSSPGRLVGDQLAILGPEPGIAHLAPFTPTPVCSNHRRPTAQHPLRLDVAAFSYPETQLQGAAALRRLPGRTIFITRSTAAVRTVTFTTSRGVRTLIPDPRTHVAMDIYDGTFPGERVKATGRLDNGRVVALVQPSGG